MKQTGEIVIYQLGQDAPSIQVLLENDTLWVDQYQISELFDTDRTSIVRHIRNIYKTSELDEEATCEKITQVQKEGERAVKRQIKIYNLDLSISVWYRVNSKQGTAFRIWANKIIKNHLVKDGRWSMPKRIARSTGERLLSQPEIDSSPFSNKGGCAMNLGVLPLCR